MKLSITFKLVSIFFVIFILATLTTSLILNYLLNDAIIDDKASLIKKDANNIADIISIIETVEQFTFLEYNLNIYRQSIDAIIMIADKEGRIILSTPSIDTLPDIQLKLIYLADGSYKLPLKVQYEPILSDQGLTHEIGSFYDLLANESEKDIPWLIIRKALSFNNTIIGTLYIFSPTPEILKVKESFYEVFMIAAGISLLLTSVLIYIYSRWFIKPIINLRYATREVAQGNYTEIIESRSKDEIGELAKNFNEMTKNLQRLDTSRRDFIANASHELRSPMTSIKGFIDAITDEIVPKDKVNDYLSLIKMEINRLNSLVTSLLDTAKFEASDLILNLSIFDINSILRSTISKFEPNIIEKNLKIHANYQEKVLLVEADEEMIERVCLNLIQNSIKYTSQSGDIYINTKKRKSKVYVSIIDNGQGIQLDEINLIWDRFYKTDRSRGVDMIGVGLGLAIVKKILDAHEEFITVSSEPNIKTEFTFTLKAKG